MSLILGIFIGVGVLFSTVGLFALAHQHSNNKALKSYKARIERQRAKEIEAVITQIRNY